MTFQITNSEITYYLNYLSRYTFQWLIKLQIINYLSNFKFKIKNNLLKKKILFTNYKIQITLYEQLQITFYYLQVTNKK